MTDVDPAYAAGLASDGLVRFMDSAGDAWLIQIREDGDGARRVARLSDMRSLLVDQGEVAPGRFGLALDEYLESIKPKPELPTDPGKFIRVTEVAKGVPDSALGVYVRYDSCIPWRLITPPGVGWLRHKEILSWNHVDIVDRGRDD